MIGRDGVHYSEVFTNREQGQKVNTPNPKQLFGDKKLPLHLIPPAASAFIALGLRDGAGKYGPWNWRDESVEVMTYIGALKRHIDAWVDGEECADDSGYPHLAHAIAGLAILIDAVTGGFAIDNRPPPGDGPAVLKEHELCSKPD